MRSNFAFLEKYWPVLAQIANMAENYLYSDPNTCMYKLGMFAERLVQEMMVFEGFSEPDDDTQSNRIRMLKRAGLLPTDIDNTLYVLRKNRNDAVHSGADSLDDAKMLLSMAYNLAVWFMQTSPHYMQDKEPIDVVTYDQLVQTARLKLFRLREALYDHYEKIDDKSLVERAVGQYCQTKY